MKTSLTALRRVLAMMAVSVTVIASAVVPHHTTQGTYAATMLKLAHDKTTWNAWFNDEGKAALTATGVGWQGSPYADTSTYQAALRTSGATSKVPDLFTWWSGWLLKDMVDAGYAADVTSLWNKDSKYYSKGMRSALTFNGKTYGLPVNLAYWVVLYNKHVFAKYHLKPPTTWAQFMALSKTLRSHGVTPMAATVDGRWPSFIYFEELLVRSDPTLYQRLMAGKAKYTDPGVVKVMKLWAQLIKAHDFTNPSSVTFGTGSNGLLKYFKQGKVAMVEIGTWYEATLIAADIKSGRDYGAFIMPNINPKAGKIVIFEVGPLLVAAHGSNKDDAMKAASWFMSKDGQQKWINLTGFMPARTGVKSSLPVDQELVRTVNKGHYKLLNRYWEATPHDIVEVAVDQFSKFMLHPDDPMSILNAIQHQADQTWSSTKS
jgi:multiple sugar transport system substrate-binding protein